MAVAPSKEEEYKWHLNANLAAVTNAAHDMRATTLAELLSCRDIRIEEDRGEDNINGEK